MKKVNTFLILGFAILLVIFFVNRALNKNELMDAQSPELLKGIMKGTVIPGTGYILFGDECELKEFKTDSGTFVQCGSGSCTDSTVTCKMFRLPIPPKPIPGDWEPKWEEQKDVPPWGKKKSPGFIYRCWCVRF